MKKTDSVFLFTIIDFIDGEQSGRITEFAGSNLFYPLCKLMIDFMIEEKLDPALLYQDLPYIRKRCYFIDQLKRVEDPAGADYCDEGNNYWHLKPFFSATFCPF